MSVNIAMWSGPRNISTAMMRAWENRPDCEVWDEPLYAAYLRDSGVVHPMQDDILRENENDWRLVANRCIADAPNGAAVFYQKHMTHHVLPNYSREWLAKLDHCFLLRHPRDVLLSYAKKRQDTTLADIGIVEQLELFNAVGDLQGSPPLIIDSSDFLDDPSGYLQAICQRLDVPFFETMLEWPAGARDSDGVWGQHWYANVWKSTGFAVQHREDETLGPALQPILDAAAPAYESLRKHCLVL
ncbi:MAG: HAD family hydrolase [Pseudomonadota bacterium]